MTKLYLIVLSVLCWSGVPALQPVERNRDFKTMITTALANGQRRIVVTPGTWYMDLRDAVPLTLHDLSDVEIIGNGAHIICNTPTQAIDIRRCKNLRISGLTIDYDPLPFTQGEIVAMDTVQRRWMEVKIYDGYRTDMIEGHLPDRLQIFDSHTHTLRENLYTYFSAAFSKAEKTGDHLFRFYKSGYNKDACEVIGDEVVFSLPYKGKTRPHAIIISQSAHVHLEDITLFAGNCFGFFELECNHNVYNRCRVTKNTTDSLVASPRLRSNNADAFHSKFAIHGPEITNCEFQYQGDDGIAINSSFYKIERCESNSVYVAATDLKIKKGHRLRFVSAEGKVMEDATVLAMQLAGTGKGYWLTLDKTVSAVAGDLFSSLDMAGAGFIIRHNRIGYTRARGILVKSSNGVIEDNMVTGCELGGIVLAPEMNWMEAGFSRNVLIKHNLIKNCMFVNASYGIEQAAALSVVAVNMRNCIAPAGGFSNIRIIGNTIENSPLPAIMITSVNGGEVTRNRIQISKDMVRSHGSRWGVDNRQPVWQMNTQEVFIRKNKIIHQ